MGPFADDVKASLRAWRLSPLLPIVTTLIAVASSPSLLSLLFRNWAGVVLLPIELFAIGWLGGTQLIWYRRAFEGQPIREQELIPLTWSLIARYVWLYLPVVVPIVVVALASIRWRTINLESPAPRIGLLTYGLVIAIVVTFVNPALAFTTRKVTKGVPIGLRILIRAWPENWQYALVPGIAGVLLGSGYWQLPSQVRPGFEIVIWLAYVMFAGAIARFYLRSHSLTRPSRGGAASS